MIPARTYLRYNREVTEALIREIRLEAYKAGLKRATTLVEDYSDPCEIEKLHDTLQNLGDMAELETDDQQVTPPPQLKEIDPLTMKLQQKLKQEFIAAMEAPIPTPQQEYEDTFKTP